MLPQGDGGLGSDLPGWVGETIRRFNKPNICPQRVSNGFHEGGVVKFVPIARAGPDEEILVEKLNACVLGMNRLGDSERPFDGERSPITSSLALGFARLRSRSYTVI